MNNTRTRLSLMTRIGMALSSLWITTGLLTTMAFAAPHVPFNELTLDDVKAGSLLLPADKAGHYTQVPALDTVITVEVSGMSADHVINQTFTNPSDEWIEAVYVYPLPDSAAVDELSMIIGDQRITGEIQTRAQARQNYTAAKNNGQRASLVERQRPNLFTTRVANIPPQGEIQIEIGFQADVRYDDGVFGLILPMTITPRYIPGNQLRQQALVDEHAIESNGGKMAGNTQQIITTGGWGQLPGLATDRVPEAYEITPPMTDTAPLATLNIAINSGLTLDKIYSSSHHITVAEEHLLYRVAFPANQVPMDRDFILNWRPLPGTSPLAAVFTQQDSTEVNAQSSTENSAAYASIMLVPPQQLFEGTVPSREVIFVIDKSGSMDGNSLVAAKEALVLGIRGLADNDTFNIVTFNDQTSTLYSQPVAATRSHKDRAVASVRRITAGGGTEIMGALNAALASSSYSERVRQIVFITDGSVGNEAEIFKQVQKKLGNNRIFTVGIGSAPNRWFMRKTAELGRGTYTYIPESAEVAEKMQALFHKLERPVLSNLQLQFSGVSNPEYYPVTVPDLYAGEPVLIDVRSIEPLQGAELRISGDENGQPWSQTLKLDSHTNNRQSGLDKLWARRKITELENSLLFNNDASTIKRKATETALEYGLVSRYTSLVAIEQTIARDVSIDSLTGKEVPLAMPAGSNMQNPSHNNTGHSQSSASSQPHTARQPSVSVPQTHPDGSPMPIPQGNLGIVLHLLLSLLMSSSVAVGAWFTRRRKHVAL